MPHFVYFSSSLAPTKADFATLPARIPTGSIVTSAEFNALVQAVYDLRSMAHSGAFMAFQRAAPLSGSPFTGSLAPIPWDLLWVNSSGSLLFRTKTGDKVVLSGSG